MTLSINRQEATPRKILLAVVGTSVIAIISLVSVLVWMASVTDKTAARSAQRIVQNAMLSAQVRAESLLTEYATLGDLHSWIEDMALGGFAPQATRQQVFHFFDTYLVLNHDGSLRHDIRQDNPNGAATGPTAAEIASLLALVGEPGTSQGLHTGFTRLGGVPHLVAGGWMTGEHGLNHINMHPHLMIAAREVDTAFLEDKTQRYVIGELSFVEDGSIPAEGLSTLTLRDVAGNSVVTISWSPDQPGRRALLDLTPAIVAFSVVLIGLNMWIGRSTAHQAKAYMHAYTLARTDQLTRLLNRAGLEEATSQSDVQSALQRGSAAVLYLDLNGFKAINDNLGHDAGDEALQITAKRILGAVRENDLVARVGGDEFVCLIMEETPRPMAHHIAQRILDSTDQAIRLLGADHFVRPAIGIATAGADLDMEALIRRADAAMYHAKKSVTDEIVFYSDDLDPVAFTGADTAA